MIWQTLRIPKEAPVAIKNRKETAWKRSKKFGDIKGGRERRRMEDNIFARAHTLRAPSPHEERPILMQDNPSRDFFFPISAEEAREALSALPKADVETITHVWLRRLPKKEYDAHNQPYAEFICGSGVRLIVLYPWPTDMRQPLGKKKPSQKILRAYQPWDPKLEKSPTGWFLQWERSPLRQFYIQQLLYREVGFHLDWYQRHWSPANKKQMIASADTYAFQKTATAAYVFNKLDTNYIVD